MEIVAELRERSGKRILDAGAHFFVASHDDFQILEKMDMIYTSAARFSESRK